MIIITGLISDGEYTAYNVGGSIRATLPRKWTTENRVKHGEKVSMVGTRGGLLIMPNTRMSAEEMENMFTELKALMKAMYQSKRW